MQKTVERDKDLIVEKLIGMDNYHTWSFDLKIIKLSKYITNETVANADEEKAAECASTISLCVDKRLFVHI
jgi:hypothetical protein